MQRSATGRWPIASTALQFNFPGLPLIKPYKICTFKWLLTQVLLFVARGSTFCELCCGKLRAPKRHLPQVDIPCLSKMGAACGKNKAKQPKRADPRELEEKARKEAEEKAAAEAAAREADERAKAEAEAAEASAAKAREDEQRAKAEADAAAAAAAAEAEAAEKARRAQEEEARRQKEEEDRKAAEAQRGAQEQAPKPAAAEPKEQRQPEEAAPAPAVEAAEPQEQEPEYAEKEKQMPPEDTTSEATMETSRPPRKVSEPQYGAPKGGRKARTVTPCDMTAVDETSMYVSKRCGCDIGGEHDENSCPICQSIDLSDAPLLN